MKAVAPVGGLELAGKAAPKAALAAPAVVEELPSLLTLNLLPTTAAALAPAAPAIAAMPTPSTASGEVPTASPNSSTFTGASARKAASARCIGGARRAASRGGSSKRSSRDRAARRAVGAKLAPQPAHYYEAAPMPFDSSRVRQAIQRGLRAPSALQSERSRGSKTPASCKGCAMITGVRIITNEFGQRGSSFKGKYTARAASRLGPRCPAEPSARGRRTS